MHRFKEKNVQDLTLSGQVGKRMPNSGLLAACCKHLNNTCIIQRKIKHSIDSFLTFSSNLDLSEQPHQMLQNKKKSTSQASLNSSNVFFIPSKITTFLLELPILQL